MKQNKFEKTLKTAAVLYIMWEGAKWSAAYILGPVTGGASLAVAALAP